MLRRLRIARQEYPRQFWLMFIGMLISTTGASMIWPFLMVYVSERLVLPMTTVASLMTINAAVGLVFAFIAGPVTDHVGRKWVMVVSLAGNGMVYLFLSQATTLPMFAILMGIAGALNPLYRVGADAMMADLIPTEKRADAYSLLRMSNNLGVAVGPAVGGFIASASYTVAFFIAATGMISYSLLLAFFASETLPKLVEGATSGLEKLKGYRQILRDRHFLAFTANLTLTQIAVSMMWVLLAVYAKQNYQVPERLYGFIPMTNATMVVLLQLYVTRLTKTRPPLKAIAVGAMFYAVGVGSIAFGRGFPAFLTSMIIITIGELILVPTSTTYTANLAPADMRGRYMSIYGLTWGAAAGIGPLLGGILNDNIGPAAIWYGGGIIGLISMVGFIIQAYRFNKPVSQTAP